MKLSQLALFDLDQTLIPIDSNRAWGHFVATLEISESKFYGYRAEQFYAEYLNNNLDIQQFLHFTLSFLTAYPRMQLDMWRAQFIQQIIIPVLYPAAYALIEQHRQANHLCAIVTATNSFIARPIADLFKIDHLIATELATVNGDVNAAFSGELLELPNFHKNKITRVDAWLGALGRHWEHFENSYFYSDSISDLPLLEKVTTPIATNPTPHLRTLAQTRNWQILELFHS